MLALLLSGLLGAGAIIGPWHYHRFYLITRDLATHQVTERRKETYVYRHITSWNYGFFVQGYYVDGWIFKGES
jgi:hypothetical protein